MTVRTRLNRCSRVLGTLFGRGRRRSPERLFHKPEYLRHSARRLEHLASLAIPVRGLSVLELGAGIGDHSHYYMDRSCKITITEARQENLDYLRRRYPRADIRFLDMEKPQALPDRPFDVIHCYGLLYHLSNPQEAIAFMSDHCRMLLLETCVSFGEEESANPVAENVKRCTQSYVGAGCRPTRPWLWSELHRHFENVYVPRTQPNHEEFAIDWSSPEEHHGLSRAVFVCSRRALDNNLLSSRLLTMQERHE